MERKIDQIKKLRPHYARLSEDQIVDLVRESDYPDRSREEIAKALGVQIAVPVAPEQESRSVGRVAGDLGLGLTSGAISGVKMISDVFGADNAVSEGLGEANEYVQQFLSAQAKADQQEQSRILREAEGKGVLEQVKAGVKAFATAPAQTVAQGLGSAAPTLAAALIPGVGPMAAAARIGAGVTLGTAQGVGAAKGAIYEEVKRKALERGDDELAAESLAAAAQAYDGPNAAQIALSGGLGALAAVTGAEGAVRALRGGATATQATRGLAARVGMGAVTEAIPEAAQGGQEKFATNTALNNAGFDQVDPWSGVAANATLEGLAAAPIGGAFAVPAPRLPDAGPLSRGVNAGLDAVEQSSGNVAARSDAAPADPAIDAPGLTEDQYNRGMDAVMAQGEEDAKAMKLAGMRDNSPPRTVSPAADGLAGFAPEVPADVGEVDALADRIMVTRQSLADEETRELIRSNMGDEALREAMYYVQQADMAKDIPDITRERMLGVAEEIVSRARLTPMESRTGGGTFNFAPTTEGLTGPAARPQIGLDMTPTGVLRADASGNVAPETNADRISTRQATQSREGDDRQARRASAVPADEAPRIPGKPKAIGYDTTPTGRMIAGETGVMVETEAERINRENARKVQPGDRLNPSGKPFKNKRAAVMEQARAGGAVVEVEGGWVVRQQAEDADGRIGETARVPEQPGAGGAPEAVGGVGGDGRGLADGRDAVADRGGDGAGVPGDGKRSDGAVPDRATGRDGGDALSGKMPAFLKTKTVPEMTDEELKQAQAFYGPTHKRAKTIQKEMAKRGSKVPAVKESLTVEFGGKTYPVESLQDAQAKWVKFEETTGAGVTQVGNGIEVKDQDGKVKGRISYNGRLWDADGNLVAEAPARSTPKQDDGPSYDAKKDPLADKRAPAVLGRTKALPAAKSNEDDKIKNAGGFVIPEDTLFKEGDGGQSPWLMKDGKVIGTGQDHLSFADAMMPNGAVAYDEFMRATGAIRAAFFVDAEEGYVATLHTHVGQSLSAEQLAFMDRLSKARGGELSIMLGQADGLVNPAYMPVTLADLKSMKSLPAAKTANAQDMAQALPKPTADADMQDAMEQAGWLAEVAGADNTIWTKQSGADRYTASLYPDSQKMEVTVLVDGVDTQIAMFRVESPAEVVRKAEAAVAEDQGQQEANTRQPGEVVGEEVAKDKKEESKHQLLNELKSKLSDLADRALDAGDGAMSGRIRGFTLGMKDTDSNLSRAWVNEVVTDFTKRVDRLEKKFKPKTEKEAKARREAAKQPAQKAEMRPYRRGDGSIGYEAVPIVESAEQGKQDDLAADPEMAAYERGQTAQTRAQDREQLERGPYARWRDANFAERREMLRAAGYTDADQGRVLSGTDWSQLTDPVRKALSAKTAKSADKAITDNQAGQPPAPSKPAASANTIFTEDAYLKAREILRKKLGQLNSGLDPEMMQAGIMAAGYHIEKGARTFAAYTKAMLEDLGDSVRPYLKSWYMGVKYDPRAAGLDGMSTAAEVEAADITAPTNTPVDQAAEPAQTADEPTTSEQDDERRNLRGQGPQALDEVAAQDDGRPEESGQVQRSTPDGGQERPADGAGVDGAGVSADRGRGSRTGAVRVSEAGAGRRADRLGDAGTGRARKAVPRADGRAQRPGSAEPAVTPAAPNVPAQNFRITPDLRLGQGGEVEKFNDNLNAIRTLKTLEAERRRATPDEQRILARYVGWGGLANAFPDPMTGEFKDKWKTRGEELRSLLSDKEYTDARRSTRNAHYTSEVVVRAMWDAARRLGFRGGLVLENSMGTGNFLGLKPEDLPGKIIGVEYDNLTSRIAQALYPQAAVLNSGFQKVPVADNAFALNIGNPPFGSESLRFQFKPELQGVSIHNQFFRAGMDAVRPGGLQIKVVSRFLMDAQDKSTRVALARQADLVAAIRLPDTAFKENARTEVVTDIIILRKLTPAEQAEREAVIDNYLKPAGAKDKDRALSAQAPAWIEVDKVRDPLGGEAMTVNRYFAQNPEQIMGVLERSGSMQHGADITVRLDDPAKLPSMLRDAVDRLPANVSQIPDEIIAATEERFSLLADALRIAVANEEIGHVKFDEGGELIRVIEREAPDGGYLMSRQQITPDSPWSEQLSMDDQGRWYKLEVEMGEDGKPVKALNKDGKPTKRNVYKRTTYANDAEVPDSLRLGKTGYERLKGLVELRDLLKKQLVLETEDAKPQVMEASRKKLAAAYEAFVASHGPVNRSTNMALAMTMPDGGLVTALEVGYQPERSKAQASRSGLEVQPEKATPAPILRERVVPKYEPPTKASTAADALAITLAERGRVDMERIASLRGVTQEEAIAELQRGDKPLVFRDPESETWETADAYLSGMVRRKLNAARAMADRDPKFDINVKALEAVQPEPWTAENVTAQMGATWVPGDVYADFITSMIGGKANVSFSAVTNSFTVNARESDRAKFDQWSTEGAPADYIVTRLLNSQPVVVTYKDENGSVKVDQERTALAQLKAKEIVTEFGDWIFKDGDRRQRLVDLFNEKFNTRVNRQFDGSHLKLPGKVPDTIIQMRRHQKNAIWRGIASRFLLLDHVVGAGKAQPLDAKLLTPHGWKRMGDIQVGDTVITVDGTPTEVEAIFPQGEKEIFRVTFSDGSSTECCDEHLWLTQTYSERGYAQRAAKLGKNWPCASGKVRSLAEIRATLKAPHLGAKNHTIPMVSPVQFNAQPLPLPPYLMGALLGDGGFSHAGVTLTTADEEIIDRCRAELPAGLKLGRVSTGDRCPTWTLTRSNGVGRNLAKDSLDALGLRGRSSADKFIPDCYLFNTVQARVDLLRGLMDTDGSVQRHSIYFYTSSEALADGVVALVQSLGGVVRRKLKRPTYRNNGELRHGLPCHVLCVSLPADINPFWLKRKAEAVVAKTSYAPARHIVAVEAVGTKPAQCIRVAHESHLYVTDDFIVTHNTFTGIARAMERRRMGLARKPMIVVPNHLVEQWAADVYRLYPGAKVLAAGQKDFEAKRRRRLFGKIATGDWDIVIVPHSSFGFIGISPETEMRYLEQEMEQAKAAIKEAEEQAKEDGQTGFRKPFGVKEAERLAEKIQTRIDKLQSGTRDRLLTFEQLGVDDLTVDEAHEFKNLFYSSRLTKVRGMGDKTGSRKAADLYNKVRVMRENGGAVTFMTGTPISNSAVEMYTMMRYLAADELQEQGLEHFDAWRTQSVEASAAFEPTESGRLTEVTRLGRTWANMRALMDTYYGFTDAVSIEDIKKWFAEDNNGKPFPVPKVKGGDRALIKVKPTEAQESALKDIIAGFDGLDGIKDPNERNAERLRLMDRARKVSLDIRAVDPRAVSKEVGGKLDRVSSEIKRIYDKSTADRGTQLVFLDRSVPKAKGDDKIVKEYDELVAKRDKALADRNDEAFQSASDALEKFDSNEIAELRAAQTSGWNAYQQIKDNLVAMGIPAAEIRFVQEAQNDEQKAALFDAVRGGKVRVLIGSTPRMGAGTNVQDRLVGLHHVDVTWKPSDIEQREGRIIRQGNKLLEKYGPDFEVEILAYATERTVDAKMWDLNAQKLRMINGIRKYDGAFSMEFEDEESVSMAEMAALASGNPLLLERVTLESQIGNLELQERAHRRKMYGVLDAIQSAERALRENPASIARAEERGKDLTERVKVVDQAHESRSVTVEGETFTDMADAMRAAQAAVDAQQEGNQNARYAVNIGGNRVTSKEAISDAIGAALGDSSPFLVKIAGAEYAQRTAAGRELARLVSEAKGGLTEPKTITLGEMFGFKLVADLESKSTSRGDRVTEVDVHLVDGERTIATAGATVEGIVQMTTNQGRKVLEQLEGDIRNKANYEPSVRYYRDQMARAERDLPGLRERRNEQFPKAKELSDKRARLEEVVRSLSSDVQQSAEPGDAAAFSRAESFRRASPEVRAAKKAEVQSVVDQITAKWKNAPDVVVLASFDEAPDPVKAANARQVAGGAYGEPEAFVYGGKAYIVADQMKDAANVRKAVFHEVLGHRGLRGVYGSDLGQILDQLRKARARDVYLMAGRYGLDPESDRDMRVAAEEVLAVMAEQNPQLGFIRRAVAAIRSWLRRNVPAMAKMRMTDDEIINDFLLPARRFIEQGPGGPGGRKMEPAFNRPDDAGAPKFSRTAAAQYGAQARESFMDFVDEIAFSRSAEPIKSESAITSQSLLDAKGGVFDFNRLGKTKQDRIRSIVDAARPYWLGALSREQLADLYAKDLKEIKGYDESARVMEAERQKMAQDADGIYSEWAQLDKEVNDRLAGIMLDATVNSVDPDAPLQSIDDNSPEIERERAKVHARISRQYAQLPREAKEIYQKVKGYYAGMLGDLQAAVEGRIERSEAAGANKAAILAKIRQQFDQYKKHGPYFPLSRFGDYLVIANRDDGERVVASYETSGEQQAAARALKEDGFKVKMKVAKTYSRADDGSAGKFIGDVLATIESVDFEDVSVGGQTADLKNRLLDDVNQLFIKSLPNLSYRKHFAHRKGTPGFSADVMRAFASSAFHGASHIARLNHADRMTMALRGAEQAIETETEGDFNTRTQVLNEFIKRHDAALNPNTHPLSALLNQIGFIMYLGLSPAAGLINLLQTAMVTLPWLGARYDFNTASNVLMGVTRDIMAAPWNRQSGKVATDSPNLTPDEKKLMQTLQDEGIIDLTQAHDLAAATALDTGNVARSRASFAFQRAMRIIGWTFHIPEVFNRQATALTAYRLEMEKSGDATAAADMAREAIKWTHFNYASSNRPRYMQGNVMRVITQFKQYSQNMTYFLGRAAFLAMKGESPEVKSIARRQLAATMVATWTMAGTLGLPGVGTVMSAIGAAISAMDDDDEPWDWQVELRKAAANQFGNEVGEVISHGLPRAVLPIDLASRVSLGDLWIRGGSRESDNPREAFAADMVSLLGPTASTLLGWYMAGDYMERGQYSKAIQAVVPKAARDVLKAGDMATTGTTDSFGAVLKPADDYSTMDVINQALGFSPAQRSEMYEARSAVNQAKTAIEGKRKALISQLVEAKIAGDTPAAQEMWQEIVAFNRRNPDFKITRSTINRSMTNRRKRAEAMRDGIWLPKGKESLREEGAFAS